MPAPEIYIDTSVIGGYFDDEFKTETRRLWTLRKKSLFRFKTSIITLEEISKAPAQVQDLFTKTFDEESILTSSPEAEELARAYMEEGLFPPNTLTMLSMWPSARLRASAAWSVGTLSTWPTSSARMRSTG